MESSQFTIISTADFNELMNRYDEANELAKRALALAEELRHDNLTILSGLKHFKIEEVMQLFGCSRGVLSSYEKKELLVPRRIFGKTLYPADRLLEFAKQYDLNVDIKRKISLNLPKRRSRKSTL